MELRSSEHQNNKSRETEFAEISPLYCDYNATTPLSNSLLSIHQEAASNHWINFSSTYFAAKEEGAWLNRLRFRFAGVSGDSNAKIVFCSSATEAINQAIYSLSMTLGKEGRIIISDLEHSAVRAAAEKWFGARTVFFSANKILEDDWEEFCAALDWPGPIAAVVQVANNESGVLLPIAKLKSRLPSGARLVLDASQALGKVPNFLEEIAQGDALIFSPHKFYGPKGLGVLAWKETIGELHSLIVGGSQENGARAGTENGPVLYVASLWMETLPKLVDAFACVEEFRDKFENRILESVRGASVVGKKFQRMGNTSTISFSGMISESIVAALDSDGIMASSGSACTSGTREPSKSYLALGLGWDEARSVVRFSFGIPNLSVSPIELAERVGSVIKRLRNDGGI